MIAATAALFLAVAGVVYAPAFVTGKPMVAQHDEAPALLASVGAALRQQSPECLLQSC